MPQAELLTGYPQKTQADSSYLCSDTAQVHQDLLKYPQIKDLLKDVLIDWLDQNGHKNTAESVRTCGHKWTHSICSFGHHKYARTHCKQDFCPTCGKTWSATHKKRVMRAMDRLLWAPVLGYMVFTLPKEVSENMPAKDTLSKLERKTWQLVKANFSTPGGMARTHFMGEQPGVLHIHINVLFPITGTDGTGKVPQATLDNIRQHWTTFVNNLFGLECKATNVFYKFAFQEWRKIHNIKYVLRPIVTFKKFLSLAYKDRHGVLSLKGWHNTRWYGELCNSRHKKYLMSKGINPTAHQDADIHTTNKCPVCGTLYRFKEVIHERYLPRGQLRILDDDTWVDLETYAHLKDEILDESRTLVAGMIVDAYLAEMTE